MQQHKQERQGEVFLTKNSLSYHVSSTRYFSRLLLSICSI